MIDQKTLKLSDLDLEFVSAKAGKKTGNNPERQLIRYNFMEIFVRLALTKYLKTGVTESAHEALQKLFSDHINGFFN